MKNDDKVRDERQLEYVGSSLKDLRDMPKEVIEIFKHAFSLALIGEKHPDAIPLKGFGGASVLEVREFYKGDTFRSMYTVKFKKAVYVLHVFKKKSKSGKATPKEDIELINNRLKRAKMHYEENYESKKENKR